MSAECPSTSDASNFVGGVSSSSDLISDPVAIPSTSASSPATTVPCSSPSASCVSTKPSDVIFNPWRNLVSQNRRRYKRDKFDLDLTYITDRIIAMGFPATDQEKLYRNSMEATVKFLENFHSGHYMVFNLRGHHVYDPSYFHNRVMTFEMNDHHPPRLELMAPFCRAVHDYLASDDRNVVAVHCKAGKGRTGVMICAYLTYINFYLSPRQNMDYYSIVRTLNNKGVTIPSQRRYVYYFSHLRRRHLNYMPLRTELIGVYFERPPRLNGLLFNGAFRLRVANGDVDVFIPGPICMKGRYSDEEEEMWSRHPNGIGDDHYDAHNPVAGRDCISRRCYGWTVPSSNRVIVEGDVRVDIYVKKSVKGLKWTMNEREKFGHIWFNTMFSCPSFCGGTYIHGDEAYPYPKGGTTIVSNWPPCKTSKSEPSSPTSDGKPNGIANIERSRQSYTTLNNTVREKRHEKSSKKAATSKPSSKRKSDLETSEDSVKCEIMLPPGLDAHCPQRCLPLIYPDERGRKPPREAIMKMLRDAHLKEIIVDNYNNRRLSSSLQGSPIPKATKSRMECGGPMCLMRRSDEHVLTFSVLEIDRAFKNDKFDLGMKVHIILRCIDPDNKEEVQFAERKMQGTYCAQTKISATRKEEARRRAGLARNFDGTSDSSSSQSSASLSSEEISTQPWRDDPRLDDPNLRKYFFKQRRDSCSVHPAWNHRCPLRCQGPSNEKQSEVTEDECINSTISHSLDVSVSLDADVSCSPEKEEHVIVEDCSITATEQEVATDDFHVTQDGKWLDESSESDE